MAATVRDVYLTRIVRVAPHAMLADVETQLLATCGDEVYVVGDEGELLGLVPDYELLKLRMLNLLEEAAAADVMTPSPPAVLLHTPLEEAACRLRVHVHRTLPVVDNGQLVGRIERRAILNWYSECARSERDGKSAPTLESRHAPPRPRFLDATFARPETQDARTE